MWDGYYFVCFCHAEDGIRDAALVTGVQTCALPICLKVAASPEDWMALVPDAAPNADYLRQELRLLHASFAQAPLLGSLLDPARSLKNDLATSSFDTLRSLLGKALSVERPTTLWGAGEDMSEDRKRHV